MTFAVLGFPEVRFFHQEFELGEKIWLLGFPEVPGIWTLSQRGEHIFFLFKNYHSLPWRDSISRLIAPVSSVAGGDDTTRPRRRARAGWTYSTHSKHEGANRGPLPQGINFTTGGQSSYLGVKFRTQDRIKNGALDSQQRSFEKYNFVGQVIRGQWSRAMEVVPDLFCRREWLIDSMQRQISWQVTTREEIIQ
jgi:hypothetical protein